MTRSTPKRGGSPAAMEATARLAMKGVDAKDRAPLYARMYEQARREVDGNLFESATIDWDLMRRGMDDVIGQYPSQINIQSFANVTCLAGDKEKTKALLDRRDMMHPDAWPIFDDFNRCVAFAYDWDQMGR